MLLHIIVETGKKAEAYTNQPHQNGLSGLLQFLLLSATLLLPLFWYFHRNLKSRRGKVVLVVIVLVLVFALSTC